MNFIFECSTRYLNAVCRVEHEKIKFISASGHVIFCLLHKHTNDDVVDDFPNISDHFLKISEDFPKLFRKKDVLFRTFLGQFPKISEDGPMMFRSNSNIARHFLRDYVTIAMVIILVTMAMPLSSHVKDIEITSWRVRAYGIFTRVGEVSEIERVSAANE